MNIFVNFNKNFPKNFAWKNYRILTFCKFFIQNVLSREKNSELFDKKYENNFKNETLEVEFRDYYFSNVIARSSKTMIECNNSKLDFKKTGTEG